MKNLIVVGDSCYNPVTTYDAIKKVALDNHVITIFIGAEKGKLSAVEWQAHFFANHYDLGLFDASINIPKRKPLSLPVSQMSRIFEKAAIYSRDNIMQVLHTGNLKYYNRVIQKAISANMEIVTCNVG